MAWKPILPSRVISQTGLRVILIWLLTNHIQHSREKKQSSYSESLLNKKKVTYTVAPLLRNHCVEILHNAIINSIRSNVIVTLIQLHR